MPRRSKFLIDELKNCNKFQIKERLGSIVRNTQRSKTVKTGRNSKKYRRNMSIVSKRASNEASDSQISTKKLSQIYDNVLASSTLGPTTSALETKSTHIMDWKESMKGLDYLTDLRKK